MRARPTRLRDLLKAVAAAGQHVVLDEGGKALSSAALRRVDRPARVTGAARGWDFSSAALTGGGGGETAGRGCIDTRR